MRTTITHSRLCAIRNSRVAGSADLGMQAIYELDVQDLIEVKLPVSAA